jgi:hypothetical protein
MRRWLRGIQLSDWIQLDLFTLKERIRNPRTKCAEKNDLRWKSSLRHCQFSGQFQAAPSRTCSTIVDGCAAIGGA